MFTDVCKSTVGGMRGVLGFLEALLTEGCVYKGHAGKGIRLPRALLEKGCARPKPGTVPGC